MSTSKPILQTTPGKLTKASKIILELKPQFPLRDFSDVFLKQIYATKNPKSAFYGKLGGN